MLQALALAHAKLEQQRLAAKQRANPHQHRYVEITLELRVQMPGYPSSPAGAKVVRARGLVEDEEAEWEEEAAYDDGEEEFRRWEIKKTGEKTYEGTSEDIKGIALGERSGNAINWHYTLKLKYGDGIMNVKFDDWLIMQDDKNVFNKATMKKFGIRLGDVYLFFTKQ